MKKLLKKEIKFITTEDLNTRYCYILSRGETFDAKDIPITDAREILWIEDELRRRLIEAVGHDFYPPTLPTIAKVKAVSKPVKPKLKPNIKIKFRIIVKSSIGSKAAQFSVEADTKADADIEARKMIRKLGLKGAKYKIS